jgi:hypothetical protein
VKRSPPIALGDGPPESLAEDSANQAVYEPLYTIAANAAPEPVLAAGPAVLQGNEVTIKLRRGVILHDGSELDAERVITALLRPGGPLGTLLFVSGARQRAATGNGNVGIRATAPDTLVFTLIAPYEGLPLLLAEPGAEIAVPSGDRLIGTGPFKITASSADRVRLEPHPFHRDGRPFLDALELKRHVSRSGVVSLLRRGEATIVFGAPEPASGALEGTPELLVLDASKRPFAGLDEIAHHDLLDAALPRERLAARFLGASARPASRLDGKSGPPEKAPGATKMSATLRVPKDAAIAHRFLERLQLDLLRGGVTVTIDRSEERRANALSLGWVPISAGSSDAARLHGLLRLAAFVRRADLLADSELIAFAASAERGAVVDRLEATLRRGAGLVPIAVRRSELAVRADLESVIVSPSGAARLADARFKELP